MIHMAFALAAAEKTAEASYAVYLWCAGSVVVVGGSGSAAAWYYSKQSTQPPENAPEDIVVDMPEEVPVHQEELRENAGLVHLNIIEANEIIAARRLEQQGAIEEGIQSFRQSGNECREATTEINDIVQRLQQVNNDAELDAETRQRETDQIIHALTTTVDALNSSQIRLAAQEMKLQQIIDRLTLAALESDAQLQEMKELLLLRQHAHDPMHDVEMDRLRNQVSQLSITNDRLYASLCLTMRHHQPQEKPMLAHSSDSIADGHEPAFFHR